MIARAISLLALGASLAAAPVQSVRPQDPTVMAPVPTPPEVTREYLRLERISKAWAEDMAKRHGLADARCTIAMPPTPRSGCSFFVDGMMLGLWKPGRRPTADVGAYLSLGNEVDIRDRRAIFLGGKWIRIGDLFEFETPAGVHAFDCLQIGEEDYAFAQCSWAADWPAIAARASYPKARYLFGRDVELDLGRAFVSGSVRGRHNGRPIDPARLSAAAREFGRQDLEALAAGPAPAPLPSISTIPMSESERRESDRLLALASAWSAGVRQRNRLGYAHCSFAAGTGGSGCSFRLDGLSLYIEKHPPDLATVKAELRFGHLWERGEGKAVILEGAWFKAGDLFELDLGGAVYAYLCRPHVPEHPQLVQCRQVREFAEIERRAAYPRARYKLLDPPSVAGLGRALVAGTAALRHNGRPRSLAPLAGGARDFARQDFAALTKP